MDKYGSKSRVSSLEHCYCQRLKEQAEAEETQVWIACDDDSPLLLALSKGVLCFVV